MLNVLFYISKSGCQWRMQPSDFIENLLLDETFYLLICFKWE